MIRRQTLASFAIVLALALLALTSLPAHATLPAAADPSPYSSAPLDPAIQSLWQTADGPVAREEAQRSWLWGPAPLAVTTEYYADSPTGQRTMVYFDKARLDINDSTGARDAQWYASGAQLVTEMLAGAIQFGTDEWVRRAPSQTAVTGDPQQAHGVTYATLGTLATLPRSLAPNQPDNHATHLIGTAVTALLHDDGRVDADSVHKSTVLVGAWDDVTQHNIADPFRAWGNAQPLPAIYVLGRPLTEPYWVDTAISGTQHRVLVQAFERRILTYTPDNPSGWQVESANVGQHYRAWRGLSQPADPALAPLATFVPSGEEIVAAANAHHVDPYLMAALAQMTSGGDPFAKSPEGGEGLLALRAGDGAVNDPAENASRAAAQIARLGSAASDDRAILVGYLGNDTQLVDAVLARRDALHAAFATPRPAPASQPLPLAATTTALVYPDGFDRGWWERSLNWYASWNGATPGWALDPAGNYCAGADYAPGERLRLFANGNTLDCTIGTRVADDGFAGTADDTALALNRAAASALQLDGNTSVRVYRLGTGTPSGNGWHMDSGSAAFYSSGYDTGWWESTLRSYAQGGAVVPGWSVDPNGYYCVHPDYRPGTRLRLVANGVTLDCTVGDTVQTYDEASWRASWAIEMSWNAFTALGLRSGPNTVEVYAIS